MPRRAGTQAGADAADAGGVVVHPLPPLFVPDSRVLLLGSMPSPKSREVQFFYGHPQNRFWPVIAGLWGEPVPAGNTVEELNAARRELCLRHRIALWDVLASCRIVGASDASITEAVPNDLSRILDACDIRQIFCTGSAAGSYYRKLIEPELGRPCVVLPSTSPANARWRLPQLIEAWAPVREAAES